MLPYNGAGEPPNPSHVGVFKYEELSESIVTADGAIMFKNARRASALGGKHPKSLNEVIKLPTKVGPS